MTKKTKKVKPPRRLKQPPNKVHTPKTKKQKTKFNPIEWLREIFS